MQLPTLPDQVSYLRRVCMRPLGSPGQTLHVRLIGPTWKEHMIVDVATGLALERTGNGLVTWQTFDARHVQQHWCPLEPIGYNIFAFRDHRGWSLQRQGGILRVAPWDGQCSSFWRLSDEADDSRSLIRHLQSQGIITDTHRIAKVGPHRGPAFGGFAAAAAS